jgi:hypothetical protein
LRSTSVSGSANDEAGKSPSPGPERDAGPTPVFPCGLDICTLQKTLSIVIVLLLLLLLCAAAGLGVVNLAKAAVPAIAPHLYEIAPRSPDSGRELFQSRHVCASVKD